MTTDRTSDEEVKNRQSEHDLDRRYGRIAISALVAVLPYRSETTSPASQPADTHKDRAA